MFFKTIIKATFPKICIICGVTTENQYKQNIYGSFVSNKEYKKDYSCNLPICNECVDKVKMKTGISSKFTDGLYITRKVGNYRGIIKNVTTSAEIQVLTSDPLASVVFIDTDGFGHIFVSVETFLSGPSINVNREIRKYGTDGELLATIRLGMNYYTFPHSDVVVDEDGTIYQLQPLKEGVKVLKWQVR